MKPLSYRLLLVCFAVSLLLFGCITVVPPVRQLGDTVIESEEVWSGTVRINGIVTVKKEGTLTIQPGTKILFVRNDLDGDGIGDSELLVEGGLIARGTVDAPIIFTSAEEKPQKADWKYLYLDFVRQAIVEHVISEYAYSGIQVHFCKASIENSVFRNNVDGVRFSTVNIVVQGNSIYNNKHGLRYEERRSKILVKENDIRDNEIGIFVVTRSEDKAKISQNNIVDNSDYNVKLGITQHADVTLPENWWGNLSVEEITTTFFDKKQDESLGQVRAPAPLMSPVSIVTAVRE
jgi:hypothetical protein